MIEYKWIKIHYGDQTDIIAGVDLKRVDIDSPITYIERKDGFKIVTTAPVTIMYKGELE